MGPCRVEDPAVCNEIERKNRYEHAFLCNIKKSLRQCEKEESQKASGNRYAQDKRNPLKTNGFSLFYHIGKKQCGVEYGEVSVTKALAMLFPKSDW